MNTIHVILWCLLAASAGAIFGAFFAWNNSRSKFISFIENEGKAFAGDVKNFITHIKAKI